MNNPMRNRMMRVGIVAISAGMAAALLSACGSESGSQTATTTPSQSATSEEPIVGGNPGTWAPVEVSADMNGKTIELVPEQTANFVGFPKAANGSYVVSSDEMVVAGSNALDETTVPGFRAVGVGSATVTLWDGDPNATDAATKGQPVAEVTVVVEAEANETDSGDSDME